MKFDLDVDFDNVNKQKSAIDMDMDFDQPELRAGPPKEETLYRPPLDERQRAEAFLKYIGQEPAGTPIEKIGQFAEKTKPIVETALLPLWKVLEGARGVVGAVEPKTSITNTLISSAYKGVAEPEKVGPMGEAAAKAYPDAPWWITGALGATTELLTLFGLGRLGKKSTEKAIKKAEQMAPKEAQSLQQAGFTAEEAKAITAKRGMGEYFKKYGAMATKKLKAKHAFSLGEAGPASQFYAGVPVPQNIIKKFNLTPTQVQNIQKGIMSGIPAGAIKELAKAGIKAPDLLAEARKYKRPEEFVESQPTKIWLSKGAIAQRPTAKYPLFAIDATKLDEKALKINKSTLPKQYYTYEKPIPEEAIIAQGETNRDVGRQLKDKNISFENVYFRVGKKEDFSIKTKSQLTDIWKQAQAPKVNLATNKQKAQAHKIAKDKALISKKGKIKPGYRRLAKSITGKSSMKEMTEDEAGTFINSLEGLSEPKMTPQGLKPPRIPITTRIAPEGYFQRRFKTPTPAKFLTSQTRYAELLGVKNLTEPFEIAKQRLDLEYGKVANQNRKVVHKVKRIKDITPEKLAISLNVNEEAPADYTPEQRTAFNYFRDLSRDLIRRENEVLTSLGFEPIKYRKGYFRHLADRMSDEIINGKYPLPEGLKFWSERVVSKKVYNPMEMKRKLEDDLLERFSKDLEYVSNAMTYSALKTIHMSRPKRFFNEQLKALSEDKTVYKNLSPKEAKFYEAQEVLPASTKKWLLDYVNIQLGDRQSTIDESFNRFVTDSQLKDIFNKILKPFGTHIGKKPVTKMIQKISRLPIYGAMGGLNPRQIIRNKFQRLQDMALYGVKNMLKGFGPTRREPTLERLKTDSLFKKSYSGFEEMPKELMGKLEKIGLAPYQWSALSNVSQAMNASYYWTKDKIVNPKNKHLGWAGPKRTYKEPKGFFYPEEEARLLKEMEYGAHSTQYQYIGMGMPEVFRHKWGSGATRLQSWWMNHWFVFHREAATRAFTGSVGYNSNLKVTAGDRTNYLKYLILGGLILTNLGYYRSYLFGTAPTSLPPSVQLALGLYQWSTNQGNQDWQKRKRSEAGYHIKQALKIHIPGYLAVKDLTELIKGDKSWKEYLFYMKEKAKSEGMTFDMGGIDMDMDIDMDF